MLKRLLILLALMLLIIVPTFGQVNHSPLIEEDFIELEWGDRAEETLRVYQIHIKTDNQVTYRSSNPGVASVSLDGLVKTRGFGQAIITIEDPVLGHVDTLEIKVYLVGQEEIPLSPINIFEPYVEGFMDGNFRPDQVVTHEQIAHMVLNIYKEDYQDPLASLYERGWMTTFNEDKGLQRYELASLLSHMMVADDKWLFLEGMDMVYDIEGLTSRHHIYTVLQAGLMTLDENGGFKPMNSVSRGQAVYILNKYFNRPGYEPDQATYQDVPKGHPYFEAIEAASNQYIIKFDN